MQLLDLLHSLTTEGLALGCVGCNSLKVSGPQERLTPELKQELSAHKPELLAFLDCEGRFSQAERQAIASEETATYFYDSQRPWIESFLEANDCWLVPLPDACPSCGQGRYHSRVDADYRCPDCDDTSKRLIGCGFPSFDVAANQKRLLEPFDREPFPFAGKDCPGCSQPLTNGASGLYCFNCGAQSKQRPAATERPWQPKRNDKPSCEHTRHWPGGTWEEADGKVSCGLCGRFYGYTRLPSVTAPLAAPTLRADAPRVAPPEAS